MAQVFADNQEDFFELSTGDILTVELSKQKAKVIKIRD
jgi:hypothetical protein